VSFDRVAPHYRWLETIVFGNQLQQARVALVREIGQPRRVLVVGEGDGRFLAEFVRAHPGAAVDCIEASGRMIELARQRVNVAQVHFRHANLSDVMLPEKLYDLVVTHFFLDCLAGDALREVVRKLAGAATADAAWLLADFRLPNSGWRRFHARLGIGAMYLFFRLTSALETRQLDDPSLFLRGSGFECTRERRSRFGMIKSELWRRAA
jgi:ubiquinone/menaquinone biosynthesis C-methylase UbiE